MDLNKKGIIFTLDVSLALLIAIVFMIIFFYNLDSLQIYELSGTKIAEETKSLTTVMEMEGVLIQEQIQPFLGNYTRNETCYQVMVFNVANEHMYNVSKLGCGNPFNQTFKSQAARTFYNGTAINFAVTYGWYR
jgi:flagellar basal body-associated protein FliL